MARADRVPRTMASDLARALAGQLSAPGPVNETIAEVDSGTPYAMIRGLVCSAAAGTSLRSPSSAAPKGVSGEDSVVYVVEAVGLGMVKIGTTRDIEERLSDLRYAAPTGLKLLMTMPGGLREERALHRRFAEHRSHGEWFHHEPIREALEGLNGRVEVLSTRLACLDCGAIRSQHSRSRAKRCKSCALKHAWSMGQRQPAPENRCLSCKCVLGRKAHHHTLLCRGCGMRKAWAGDAYRASVMAARTVSRKRCLACNGTLEVKSKAKYHAHCWERLSGVPTQRPHGLHGGCNSGGDVKAQRPAINDSANFQAPEERTL